MDLLLNLKQTYINLEKTTVNQRNLVDQFKFLVTVDIVVQLHFFIWHFKTLFTTMSHVLQKKKKNDVKIMKFLLNASINTRYHIYNTYNSSYNYTMLFLVATITIYRTTTKLRPHKVRLGTYSNFKNLFYKRHFKCCRLGYQMAAKTIIDRYRNRLHP